MSRVYRLAPAIGLLLPGLGFLLGTAVALSLVDAFVVGQVERWLIALGCGVTVAMGLWIIVAMVRRAMQHEAQHGLQMVGDDTLVPAAVVGSVNVEKLIALNDEITALVRAGVPLEHGLREVGQDLPDRLGQLATWMAERLERGESLEHVMESAPGAFSPSYRAVVAAGVRCGSLPAALEGISSTMRRSAHIRRVMIVGIVYPLAVLAVATGVFFFTARFTRPVVNDIYGMFGLVDRPWWFSWYEAVLTTGPGVAPYVWCVLAVLLVIWLYRSSRAVNYHTASMRGVPTVAKLIHAGRMATFADVLALMIEQEVPLAEAVSLSASASGDRALRRASETLAEGIRAGDMTVAVPSGFPPMLGWLLATGHQPQQIIRALRDTAHTYRARAQRAGTWLTVYLPIVLSAGVGGTITLFYVLVVMAPFYHLLFELSKAP